MMVNDGWLRMGLIMGSIMGLYIWLVVTGTMEFWTTFHNIWEFHHPNWRSPSFFRGVGQPPSWIIYRIILPVDELIFFIRWLLHHQPERAATLCNVCKMHGLENARYLYRCSLNFIVHWFCWSNGAPADCCIFLCFFFFRSCPKAFTWNSWLSISNRDIMAGPRNSCRWHRFVVANCILWIFSEKNTLW